MEVLIEAAPRTHPGFLGFTVERGVRQLDTQRDVVDRQSEEILEEDDARLSPGDLSEVTGPQFNEGVDQLVRLVPNLWPQRLHPRRREVRVQHLTEFLLPRRIQGDHQIARELLRRFRRGVTGEVLPVLQNPVALRVSRCHPRATGSGAQKRRICMSERRIPTHDRIDVVQEVVVLEILVTKVPVVRVLLECLGHGAGAPCCWAACRATRASWMRTSSRNFSR